MEETIDWVREGWREADCVRTERARLREVGLVERWGRERRRDSTVERTAAIEVEGFKRRD